MTPVLKNLGKCALTSMSDFEIHKKHIKFDAWREERDRWMNVWIGGWVDAWMDV